MAMNYIGFKFINKFKDFISASKKVKIFKYFHIKTTFHSLSWEITISKTYQTHIIFFTKCLNKRHDMGFSTSYIASTHHL